MRTCLCVLACGLAGCGSQIEAPAAAPPPSISLRSAGEIASRQADVQKTRIALEAEAKRHGGWDAWQTATAGCREQLRGKIPKPPSEGLEAEQLSVLSAPGFPLCEIRAREQLRYLHDATGAERVMKDRTVEIAARWLKMKGIDLIFVPVPKMTEVYAEHFVSPCPADGVIAPHVRKLLWELANADVEVVDVFSAFHADRGDLLYQPADTHWAPRGQRVAAGLVAKRLERYACVAAHNRTSGKPTTSGRKLIELEKQDGWGDLTAEQQSRAKAVPPQYADVVTCGDGPLTSDPDGPVLLMGNSYTWGFREQLALATGMRLREKINMSDDTNSFGDFLRDPELLAGVRAVVWVTTTHHMSHFKPLPAPVLAALGE